MSRISNSSRARELVSTVEDIEALVRQGLMTNSQLAKLYGFTEKLLLTKIDNMQVSVDGGDETDPALRVLRKDLVGRCNALMDSLEKLRDKAGAEDPAAAGVVAVGISVGEAEDLDMCAVLKDGTPLRTAGASSAGDGAVTADAIAAYRPPIHHLIGSGFFSSLGSSCVVARLDPSPYLRMCEREEESKSGRRLRSVHTHSAAAAGVVVTCAACAGCYVLLSVTATALHVSVVNIEPAIENEPRRIVYLSSGQHPITTRGSQSHLAASAATIAPLLDAALHKAKANGIIIANTGTKLDFMNDHVLPSLRQAFPETPLLVPALGSGQSSLHGVVIKPDFVAHGAAVLALSGSAPDVHVSPQRVVDIVEEPLHCFIGLRTRLMPSESYTYTPNSGSSEADDDFNALMTCAPMAAPSLPLSQCRGIQKTLTLMTCDSPQSGPRTGAASAGRRVAAHTPGELFVELVQAEPSGPGALPGWGDGALQSAVPRKPSALMAKLGGLSVTPDEAAAPFLTGGALVSVRGAVRYRVLGRYSVGPVPATDRSDGNVPTAVMQVTVGINIDADRGICVAVHPSALGAAVPTPLPEDQAQRCDFSNSIYHIPPKGTGGGLSSAFYIASTEEADLLKQRGNEALRVGTGGDDFECTERAVCAYSLALQWDPLNAVLYSNRCAARLKLCALQRLRAEPALYVDGWLTQALTDAEVCVRLRPSWSKAHSRLGEVLFRQNRLEASLDAYNRAYSCEQAEQGIPPGGSPTGSGGSGGGSSILRALTEVKGAWDLQVATKAAQEAERLLRSEAGERGGGGAAGSPGKKKRKTTEDSSSSKCVVS